MSEVTPAETVTPEAEAAQPEASTLTIEEQLAATQAKLTETLAEARKHESRAKENFAKAKQLDEITEAQKTAEQKTADELAELKKRAEAAEIKLLRSEIASSISLPANLHKYLTGTTKEELEASAADLLADFKASPEETVITKPAAPKPNTNQGRIGSENPLKNADRIAAAIAKSKA